MWIVPGALGFLAFLAHYIQWHLRLSLSHLCLTTSDALAVLTLIVLYSRQLTVSYSQCARLTWTKAVYSIFLQCLTQELWPGHHSKHPYEQMFLKLKPSFDNRYQWSALLELLLDRSVVTPGHIKKLNRTGLSKESVELRDLLVKRGHCLAHTGTVPAIFRLYSWWDLNNSKWKM